MGYFLLALEAHNIMAGYIHNDTMSALERPQDMFSDTAIQLQPVFAQWIQNTHALAPTFHDTTKHHKIIYFSGIHFPRKSL